MELNKMVMVRKEIGNSLISKLYCFKSKEDFVSWVKGMTQAKFKTFILQCLDNVIADGDAKKTDLLEIKKQIE